MKSSLIWVPAAILLGIAACPTPPEASAPDDGAEVLPDLWQADRVFPDLPPLPDAQGAPDIASPGQEAGPQRRHHEDVLGGQWPAMVFVLDASVFSKQAMVSGGGAWSVMVASMTSFAGATLPVRLGLVVYGDEVLASLPLPHSDQGQGQGQAVTRTLGRVAPGGLPDTAAGLLQAIEMVQPRYPGGNNVILMSTALPAVAQGCQPRTKCCVDAALLAAQSVRLEAHASLFTVELPCSPAAAHHEFLTQAAGMPATSGGNWTMSYYAPTKLSFDAFLSALARGICAFALSPAPWPRMHSIVEAQIRDPEGAETPLVQVADRDQTPDVLGYEYYFASSRGYLILTKSACSLLGTHGARRLAVRWN